MALSLRHDENGLITEGKYTGQHIDDVTRYLEGLENAAESAGLQPREEPPPAETPEQRLARTNAARNNDVVGLLQSSANRQEQDDEESFAASVDDYDEYRERIAAMKKGMTPAQRVVRGVHRQMYLFIKVQSGEHANKLMGKQGAPAGEATEEIPETPPATIPEKKPVQTTPPTPKPAPPAARPTPGRTEPARVSDTHALKATARIERVAHGMGIKVDDYLKQLEARGVTQTDIDKGEIPPGGSVRRKTPYDYGTE